MVSPVLVFVTIVELVVVVRFIKIKFVGIHRQMVVHEELVLQGTLLLGLSGITWLLVEAGCIGLASSTLIASCRVLSAFNLTVQIRCLLDQLVHGGLKSADVLEESSCALRGLRRQLGRILPKSLLLLTFAGSCAGSLVCRGLATGRLLVGNVDLVAQ